MSLPNQISNEDLRALAVAFLAGDEVTCLRLRADEATVKAALRDYFVARFAELGITLTLAG